MDSQRIRQQHLQRRASSSLYFFVNEDEIFLENVNPRTLLAEWLRENGYTGTKIGCGQGGCGACTVMLSSWDEQQQKIIHRAVNACMRPLCAVDGMQVTTVEGVGSVKTQLDPIQRNLALHDGSQCGYCSPGFVMNMYAMRQDNPSPSQEEIENRFDGNLCRCTGYRSILYAMRLAAQNPPVEPQLTCWPLPEYDAAHKQNPQHSFPDVLKSYGNRSLYFEYGAAEWYRPLSLSEVYDLMKAYAGQNLKLVVGNTSIGIYPDLPNVYVDVSLVPELNRIDQLSGGISVGGAVTINRLMETLEWQITIMPPVQTIGYHAMLQHLQRLANVMVRSAGSIAGNIMLVKNHQEEGTGEPFPSDLFLMLATLNATVKVGSTVYPNGFQVYNILEMPLWSQMPVDAVILAVNIPYSQQGDQVFSYKVARREQNAHAIVNAGFYVNLTSDLRVRDARLIYGGLQRTPINLTQIVNLLYSNYWDEQTLYESLNALIDYVSRLTLYHNDEGFTDAYRRELASTLYYKFYVAVALAVDPGEVAPDNASAGQRYVRPLSTGQQHIIIDPSEEPVSDPIMKFGAFMQTTGEAKYTQDVPLPQGGYEGYFVFSTRAHATFKYSVDLDQLINLLRQRFNGFRDYLTVRDIPEGGMNNIGFGSDDLIFADGTVDSFGQQIGLVLATNFDEAMAIAQVIQNEYILYSELPAILDIPTAIQQKSFFVDKPPYVTHIHAIERMGSDENWLNNPTYPLQAGDTVVQGQQSSGSQAHFYMEPNATIAVPGEGATVLVYSSTQDIATVQRSIAQVTTYKNNNISVYVKRLGGGFGGKETRPPMVACAAALAAIKLNRPIRVALDRASDMWTIGKRHDLLGEYALSVSSDGIIHGWKQQFYSDGGMTYDVSFPVMDLILLCSDNAYMVNTFQSKGDVCKTNKASNTAMRSFGVIQMALVVEEALEKAAYLLKMRPEDLREKNFYLPNNVPPYQTTPYNTQLQECKVWEVWTKLRTDSDFDARRQQVEDFNRSNKWHKRGISIMPLKYGVSYTAVLLDQGAALLNTYYADGTIILQHGGVEMGQGIHTKMAQICAQELNVPITKIRVGANLTDVVPNTSSTGASTGTDLNGGAVINAAEQLRLRLEAFLQDLRVKNGEQWCKDNGVDYWNYPTGWKTIITMSGNEVLMWDNVVSQAYSNRIDLSSQAFFRYPYITDVTSEHPYGIPFFYYNYAAACSEVEIDVLTGEYTIIRSDILYDAGQSINPCVDVGQIEGAFIQGVGYVTTEEIVFNAAGQLVTDNTWTYKPPDSKTIPLDFRVSLLNTRRFSLHTGEEISPTSGVKSSKSTGEPPLVLSNTVFFAIKHAILAAREEQGVTGWFEMPAPATVQTIQTYCQVNSKKMSLGNSFKAKKKGVSAKPKKPKK